jgi:predicted NBD/HSP70 family sugar kinase
VAAAIATIFGVVIGATTLLLALLNIREKLAPKSPATTHPLEAALRDIAAAVRELADARPRG